MIAADALCVRGGAALPHCNPPLPPEPPTHPALPNCSLHQVHDEEKGFEMELAWICEESGRQFQRVPQQLVDEAGACWQGQDSMGWRRG